VRYKPELKYIDLLLPAAQYLDGYQDWETDRLRVTLKNYDRHCSFVVEHRVFGYEQDSSDLNMDRDYIQQALQKLPPALQIQSFTRFGYRRQYLIEVDMSFESLVSVSNVKLFSQDSRLRQIMPAGVEDLMCWVDSVEEPYHYKFIVGPVRKQEIPQHIVYNFKNHLNPATALTEYPTIVAKYPEVALLVDIDFYQAAESLLVEDATPFVDVARQKVHKLANDLCEYIFAMQVEE